MNKWTVSWIWLFVSAVQNINKIYSNRNTKISEVKW
jgi:hypothetical protein